MRYIIPWCTCTHTGATKSRTGVVNGRTGATKISTGMTRWRTGSIHGRTGAIHDRTGDTHSRTGSLNVRSGALTRWCLASWTLDWIPPASFKRVYSENMGNITNIGYSCILHNRAYRHVKTRFLFILVESIRHRTLFGWVTTCVDRAMMFLVFYPKS